MNETKNLPIIFVLFFMALLSLFYLSGGINFLFYSITLALSVIIFSTTNANIGFLFLLVLTVAIGFFKTWVTFFAKTSNINQFSIISEHIILVACLSTLWLIFHTLKKIKAERLDMINTIEQLKKYETTEQILTKTEFLSRTKFILTGMKRRNEKGYLLTLRVNEDKKHVRDSIFYSLAKTTLGSIRGEFDLAGKLSDDSILVLLQNTNEIGCEIVTQRLEKNLGEILNIENKPYSIEIRELNNEIYTNLLQKGIPI